MRPTTPLQAKTPFAIHHQPFMGALTARAGLSLPSRALRSLGLPNQCAANLPTKQRARGYTAAQYIESLILLHAAGGECQEDMEALRRDPGVTKLLGYQAPSARSVGDFLDVFHEERLIQEGRREAERQGHLAMIPEQTALLHGLRQVQRGNVRAIVGKTDALTIATIDMDATIIESDKRNASYTYEGSKGYQPMVAVWAEADVVVADEFRDGNVPAMMAPLACAKAAFEALPAHLKSYGFRGDSACHEQALINWLRDEEREDWLKGRIEFAVSARMSEDLGKALRAVPEQSWVTMGKESDGTLKQWADVDFVPGEKSEHKETRPLRYVGLRFLKPQGDLFADGHDRRFYAVLTNRAEKGDKIIEWHREKAGTIEHVHEELKNGLGGGRMPSNKFGVNAAWFRIACLAYNILSAVRQNWPDDSLRTAKAKRLRFALFFVTGRFSRDRRKITLRLAAPREWIQRMIEFFKRFALVTRSTG